jgi:DNA-binding transcriptional ArsR family regulator
MIDQTLHALAEPRRREILGMLADGELAAGAIAARFEVTRPAVSQHLAVLRAAGLVAERRDGARRLYRARPAGLEPLREWLGRFWDDGLERLRVAAEAEAEAGRMTERMR